MRNDARPEASAPVDNSDEQEPNGDRKHHLQQRDRERLPTSVHAIHNVANPKGHAGDDDRLRHTVFCDRAEVETAENEFLQKSHT